MDNKNVAKAIGACMLEGTAAMAVTGSMTNKTTKKKMKKTAKKAMDTVNNVMDNVNQMMK